MNDYIAQELRIEFTNSAVKTYERVSQFYTVGNFLTISAIPLTPVRGNVLVTERYPLSELEEVVIKFN